MVTVITRVPNSQHHKIIAEITATVNRVASITPRSRKQLFNSLRANNMALAFDGDKLIGWLISLPYSNRVQEVGMAYLEPEYRRQGIFNQMFGLLADKRPVTVAVTYEPKLVDMLVADWGFTPSSLLKVTSLTEGRFIKSRLTSLRTIKAMLSHISKSKPLYMVRDKQ